MRQTASCSALAAVALVVMLGWAPPNASAGDEPPALSDAIVGQEFVYTVQPGESLTRIGARFGENPAVLANENGLRSGSMLRANMTLKIDNRHIVPKSDHPGGILINIPQRMLFLFRAGALVTVYPVGLGRPDWPTPIGRFRIVHMQQDKEWIVPKSIQEEMRREGKDVLTCVPPGPGNPLGRYWIGLSIGSIGIHGTLEPSSVYHFRSHGCIRLHPDDVAGLFAEVVVGERGSIEYFPVLVARLQDRLYLEVHRDVYKRGVDALAFVLSVAKRDGLGESIDWDRVDAVIAEQGGLAREIGRRRLPRKE